MAARTASRLKVYVAQIGFHCIAIAAPNQKAALAAWDVRTNLFADGRARVATDPETIKLALTAPGQPVRFPTNVVSLHDHRRRPGGNTKAPSARSSAARRPAKPPRRSRALLDKAEASLGLFKKRAIRERAAMRRHLQTLQDEFDEALDEAEQLEADLEAEKHVLEAAVAAARNRYEGDAS